jgi:hypothetical protein
MLVVEFELGDYVNYSDDNKVTRYNSVIEELAARPRSNTEDSAYISIGPPFDGRIITEKNVEADDDAWQSIVDRLGRLNDLPRRSDNKFSPSSINPFERVMFFRVVNLERLPRKKVIPMKELNLSESGYEIKGGGNYRLNLLFYYPKRPHADVRRSKIVTYLNSEFINGIASTEISLNFRYDRRHIDFVVDRVFETIWTVISLSVAGPRTETVSKDDMPVSTPSPRLMLKIKASRLVSVLAPVIFALATIISTLNVQVSTWIVGFLPSLSASKDLIAAASAVIGSVIATVLLFYLYRKLK